jgi:HD superfamily phosphodiesterase
MNTANGREIAKERHIFMQKYLEEFFTEWNAIK